MTIFDENLILETINMIKLHNFDIRTVTLETVYQRMLTSFVIKFSASLINMQKTLLNMPPILKTIILYLSLTKGFQSLRFL